MLGLPIMWRAIPCEWFALRRIRADRHRRNSIMDHATDKIHVMPEEGQWDVEDQDGLLLAHFDDRTAAIKEASELAAKRGLTAVVVHDGDGVTEEVPV